MKINRKELQTALEIVKPGLANREVIEQANSFAFMGDRLVTYNDEISISHPISGLEITGAVKADELYKFINKVKKDELEFELTDNEIVLISGRSKAGFAIQSEIKLPIKDIGNIGKWKALPDDFMSKISFVLSSAGKTMSKPILACVHVNKEGFVEASDGFRITKNMLSDTMPVKTFLIPATSVSQIIRLKPSKIAEGQGWIHFKTESETTISCRIFEDDKFPETSNFFKVDGDCVEFPNTLLDIIDRALIFSNTDLVDILIKNKRFKVSSKNDTGWFEEEANSKYDGNEIQFTMNPNLLKDILSVTKNAIIGDDKLKFEGEDWVFVTVLQNKQQ